MIFEALWRAAEAGELVLVDGGFCHWHLRRDGQITIREIIVLPECQRQGIGKAILEKLMQMEGATSIFAKCPDDLPANGWYKKMGFEREVDEVTRSGRRLFLWRLQL
jgi:ribosomal protein S18 acetylase RimI-like enzyme